MNTAVIKINNLDQALMLSRAYKEGEIKLNVSKLARELNCSRKTLSRRLNGIAPKKTRNRKRYLDDYKNLIYKYLCDEQGNFDYIDHIYYFMKREHGITSTIMETVGIGTASETVIPDVIVSAIEDVGFLESIPLWAVTLLGSIFITILSFIMILTIYGRFFKLYLYTAIPLSTAAGEST